MKIYYQLQQTSLSLYTFIFLEFLIFFAITYHHKIKHIYSYEKLFRVILMKEVTKKIVFLYEVEHIFHIKSDMYKNLHVFQLK